MNPGSPEDMRQTAVEITARFMQGLGATIRMDPPNSRAVYIHFVPGPLIESHGLLIAVQGQGSILWNAERPLNSFQLASAGVKLLPVCEAIAALVNGTYRQLLNETGRLTSSGPVLIEDGSKKGTEDQ